MLSIKPSNSISLLIYVILIYQFAGSLTSVYEASAKQSDKIISINTKGADKSFKKHVQQIEKDLSAIEYNENVNFIRDYLLSQGFYDQNVDQNFSNDKDITYIITPGFQYKFGDVRFDIKNKGVNSLNLPELVKLNAKTNEIAFSEIVYDDLKEIENWIESNNCIFKYTVSHDAQIDRNNKKINIIYKIVVDQNVQFGSLNFSGQQNISKKYLQNVVNIKEGTCFKRSVLQNAKRALHRTGLIKSVEINLPPSIPSNSKIPINFSLQEKKHRSLKIGAKYSTDQGLGSDVAWEHRNLFSNGEKLNTKFVVQDKRQRFETTFEKPHFLRTDQKLQIANIIKQEEHEAYSITSTNFSGTLERQFNNDWVGGAGVEIGYENTKEQNIAYHNALMALPLFVSQDKRNNILNPTKGWRIYLSMDPVFDVIQIETAFVKANFKGSIYRSLSNVKFSPTLAVRASFGSILANKTKSVPASERFFVGGAGSIRGYSYQTVGPLNKLKKPLGGRSYIETSIEVRTKFSEDYGIVGFIDGGNVYDEMHPTFKNGMLFGGGLGFRYYTSFGPIRADIAVPLNKRRGIDDAYQLYFSIGQSF